MRPISLSLITRLGIYVYLPLLAVIGFLSVVVSPTSAHADSIGWGGWCSDENISPKGQSESGDGAEGGGCLLSNYYKIPEDIREEKNLTEDKYLELAQRCLDDPSTVDGGPCINAVRSCYTITLDTSKCEDSHYLTRIADECGMALVSIIGGPTGGGVQRGDNCNPISEANAHTLDDDEAAYRSKMDNYCGQQRMGNERNECYDIFNRAVAECAARAGLGTRNHNSRDGFDGAPWLWAETPDGGYNSMDLNRTQYGECLDSETRKNIKDPTLCRDVGGVWAGAESAGNGVQGDTCYHQYSDLTNATACKNTKSDVPPAPEGVWAQDSTGSWGCHLPSEVCDNEDYKINDRSGCSDENKQLEEDMKAGLDGKPGPSGFKKTVEDFDTCGKAQTVLLSCSDDSKGECPGAGNGGAFRGVPVLGCILRIGIQVLTTLIGIGAVGGIAFEAFKYAKSGDSSSDTANAKERIRDIVIGLVVYVFMLVVVQWLIPGLVI